jgi:hypothetical protein
VQGRRNGNVVRLVERESAPTKGTEVTLETEISLLREVMEEVRRQISSGEGDPAELAKMGTLLARLSDSVVRAVLAQQKLSEGSDRMAKVLAEMDHVLRVMGEIGET